MIKNNSGFAVTALFPILTSLTILIFVVPIIFSSFNISPISLSEGFMNTLNHVKYIFYVTGYFIPIQFILYCLIIVMFLKHSNLFFSLVNFIYRKITGK